MEFQEEESKNEETDSDMFGDEISETCMSIDQDDLKIKQDQQNLKNEIDGFKEELDEFDKFIKMHLNDDSLLENINNPDDSDDDYLRLKQQNSTEDFMNQSFKGDEIEFKDIVIEEQEDEEYGMISPKKKMKNKRKHSFEL